MIGHWNVPAGFDPNHYGAFTYMCQCVETGQKYIGFKKIDERGRWQRYRTSSKVVHRLIEEGKSFVYTILAGYATGQEAMVAEGILIEQFGAVNSDEYLNQVIQGATFNYCEKKHSAEAIAKIKKAKTGRKLSASHRANIGKGNLGRVVSQETIEKRRAKAIGQKRTAEFCQHMSDVLTGRTRSEESVEKQRAHLLAGNHPKFKGWYVINGERYPSKRQTATALGIPKSQVDKQIAAGIITFIPKDEV